MYELIFFLNWERFNSKLQCDQKTVVLWVILIVVVVSSSVFSWKG